MKHCQCPIFEKLVLKRNFQELYINNYNVAWLEAWDAIIDLQLCSDTYAVITYICDYYSKDETGMTDLLKETIRTHDTKQGNATLLRQMKNVYLSHRQVSACEATYRLLPRLHLKESNITTVFVSTGFPENRYRFLKYVDDYAGDTNMQNCVAIDGREGQFVFTKSLHKKYSKRPMHCRTLSRDELYSQSSSLINENKKVFPHLTEEPLLEQCLEFEKKNKSAPSAHGRRVGPSRSTRKP